MQLLIVLGNFLSFFFFFNWCIVDLYCCVSSPIQQSESGIHTHIPAFLNFLYIQVTQSNEQSSLCYTVGFLLVYLFYTQQCIYVNLNPPIHSNLLFLLGIHTFVLYICVSISALPIRSYLTFFQIPHVCVNICYLFSSF